MAVNLSKTKTSNEKRRLYRRENYENTHLDVGVSAVRNDRLCRDAAAGDDHDHDYDHTRGDVGSSKGSSCDARSRRAASTTVCSNRSAKQRSRSGLHLDARLLAMVGTGLCMGVGLLGQTTTYHGCLGPRTLGEQRRRLGLGSRPLAITSR